MFPRWSPDGKQIVFYGWPRQDKLQGDLTSPRAYKIYVISRDGGDLEQLIPNNPGAQTDPGWSPDGGKIVFARGVNTDFSVIHVFDLASHQISTLPESQGYYSPHWSPDGDILPPCLAATQVS
ncbi:MAG: hypothetical protein WAK33_17910 [Silvibacterium sp.]